MNKIGKSKIIIAGTVLILLALVVFVVFKIVNNDPMETTGNLKVQYRTYTKENGWSSWTKNGKTSGNEKDNILNIQIKVGKKEKGKVVYRIYTEDWSEYEYDKDSKIENKQMNAIRIGLTDTLYKKYDVCYRTTNKETNWLEWACDGEISGNKDSQITGIQVKIIPKGIIKNEYLEGFNTNENNSSLGF